MFSLQRLLYCYDNFMYINFISMIRHNGGLFFWEYFHRYQTNCNFFYKMINTGWYCTLLIGMSSLALLRWDASGVHSRHYLIKGFEFKASFQRVYFLHQSLSNMTYNSQRYPMNYDVAHSVLWHFNSLCCAEDADNWIMFEYTS